MKKYLCLISFAMVFLFGLSAFAEENEDYVVLSYDMTTRNVITENLGKVSDTEYFQPTKAPAQNVRTIREIIGDDDRAVVKDTTVKPYSCIGYLRGQKYNGEITKTTAFLVSDSTVLTAAHNVFPLDQYKEFRFYPGYNSLEDVKAPYGYGTAQAIATIVHVPENYKEAYAKDDDVNLEKYDYALIELDKTLGNSAGWLPLVGYNTAYNENTLVGRNVVIVGYPKATNHYMWRDKKPILSVSTYLIGTKADATTGQNGGPMLISANNTYYVVGIYTNRTVNDVNYGRYITKKISELVAKY